LDVQTKMLRVKSAENKPTCLAIFHYASDEAARLKASLRETQARKNAILESSIDPIITINHEGAITEFNRAAEHVFGRARATVLGAKPADILFPPVASPDQENRIDRYLTLGEGSLLGRRTEVTAMRANGETFAAEMAMTLSREQGEPVLTFFLRDISRRKKAEMEQARYAAELERSNRELEQFAYVASHDLQEPLRKIGIFSSRLQAQSGDQLDEMGRQSLQRMQSAAERMKRLVDGLLQLSRVTTQARQFVAVDLMQVAREVVSDLEVKIEQVRGRVELDHLPTIEADPLQMRQLLQNLIANGLKFHRDEAPPVVVVSGRYTRGRKQRQDRPPLAEKQCCIVVEDNGIGFDEKDRERIFRMFQRLHGRDRFEGTGIGLAICRKIVERHGGRIAARSTPGKGSVFEVLLPVAQNAE
jgi:two-component system, LuxR family, sensor kinase FixL